MTVFEWAIIAFITVSILWHVWKGGAANPESTGTLGRRVSGLSSEVETLSGRVGRMEGEVKELKQKTATTKDVEKLEELIDARMGAVRAEIEGHRALSQQTNDSVRRIERVLIEKGLGK